jgi:hypothetical protein
MNSYTKFNGAWCITGSGPTPAAGATVPVTTRRGITKQEKVKAILVNGTAADGKPIWIAALEPREPASRPWRNYDEVGTGAGNY